MNLTPKRLLLADNSSEYRHSMRGLLQLENYVVQEAGSPDEARALLETSTFDLALVDMRLQDDTDDADYSGFEIAKRATELGIRSIIITLFPDVEPARRALRSRGGKPLAVDFIKKTDGPQALLDSIRLVLDNVEAAPELSAPLPGTGPLRGQTLPDGLYIDLNKKLVWNAGKLLDVSDKQYDLLACVYERGGGVCSHQELIKAIYEEDVSEKEAAADHRLKHLADRLKKKLVEEGLDANLLVTASGRGYRLNMEG